ncbi:MAG: 30S ribosomal protein S4 [Candidatus Bathyarchaeota archaeon B24]|nr:MAG: 30S ribosomal protein S4 [Candidatus Bathyarchaeota archaeon B24]RLI25674.1 MAG: 30S ribosomal protein S4 [Candidatus Bathyarchaeota archaeon]
MGDPKKQRKKYETPKKPWDAQRLQIELRYMGEYGLRNKRELWKHRTQLSRIRAIARSLLAQPPEVRAEAEKRLLGKLRRMGLLSESATLEDVLDLTIDDILNRRLQTLVYKMGLAKTIYQARQLIVHGHIAVKDRVVRVPSYLVKAGEDSMITYAPKSPFNDPKHPVRIAIETLHATAKMEEVSKELGNAAEGS